MDNFTVSQSTLDEIRSVSEASAPYYRILLDDEAEGPFIAHMNWLDELDYDASRFVTDKKYATGEEAAVGVIAVKLQMNMPLTRKERLKIAQSLLGE